MYTPQAFKEDRPEILHQLVRSNSFATIVSCRDGMMVASHLPLLLDAKRGKLGILRGHMARPNEQWPMFEDGSQVLAIFPGPHAYISPSWYKSPAVPTWNYAAVHAYGTPRLIADDGELRALLEETVLTYESGRDVPWTMGSLPGEYVDKLIKGIVGFEIEVVRWEGKQKLSQNRPLADRQGAIEGLTATEDPASLEVARLMAGLDELR